MALIKQEIDQWLDGVDYGFLNSNEFLSLIHI